MRHRPSKIYTRTGDNGSTGLRDGSRTAKDDPRIEAIGAVDELNSAIGLLLTETLPNDIRASLTDVQHALFELGGELSTPHPAPSTVTQQQTAALEQAIDRLNADLPPLEEFVLPGGARGAAICHLTRAICRRAERRVCALSRKNPVSEANLRYLNRLSDLLFVIARNLNQTSGMPDVRWHR